MNKNSNSVQLGKLLEKRAPEYAMLFFANTEEDFEKAFDYFLINAIVKMEEDSKKYKGYSEDSLSSILSGILTMPGVAALRENNQNGHVDITITIEFSSPKRIKLAEAKIWRGPSYHVKGMEQLIERYSTGRQNRGMVIAFVQKPDIKTLFEKLKKHLNVQKPLKQLGECKDYTLKWSLLTKHKHSSGEKIEVLHVGCNMFYKQ